MVVEWLAEARDDLARIWNYYGKRSPRAAAKIVGRIESTVLFLGRMPLAAPLERHLEGVPGEYRSMVVRRRYKVIYRVVDETIYVTAVWDCRRNPDLLRRMTLRRRAKI